MKLQPFFLTVLLLWARTPLAHAADETASAPANTAITTEGQLDEWMSHYYEHPQPGLTCSAISFMSVKGIISPDNGLPTATFFARLLEQNPSRAQEWRECFTLAGDDAATTIAFALWMTKNESELKGMLAAKPDARVEENLREIGQHAPPDLMKDEIDTPTFLDMLWGSFFATGDEKYVFRVIEALAFLDDKRDVQKTLIGSAARWSLASNAAQHKRVMQICEEQQQKSPDKTLKDVIKEAHKQAKVGGGAGS